MKTHALILATTLAVTPAFGAEHFPNATPLNIAGAFSPNELPPEPNRETQPGAHAAWSKLRGMTMIPAKLEVHPNVFHGPAQRPAKAYAGPVGSQSFTNWSGAMIEGTKNQYSTTEVAMSFIVPKIQQPLNADSPQCNPSLPSTYVAAWVGIDGWGSNTVEQAGLWASIINCNLKIAPFIEAYPNPEIGFSNMPFNPGDAGDIWNYVSGQNECAIVENETQNIATSACIVAPGPFTATSVEWIVEAPSVNGNTVALANYVRWQLEDAWAWDYKTGVRYGAGAATPQDFGQTGQFYYVYMVDNENQIISLPISYYPAVLVMSSYGAAYCEPGTTCVPKF